MHKTRKASPKETKKRSISLKAIPWFFKCFQTFSKASRLLLTCGELPFWKHVLHGSSPWGLPCFCWCLSFEVIVCFIIRFATAGKRVPGNVQSVRIPSYPFYRLQFSLLFSYKNNENCSITFFQMLHTAWWYLMLIFHSVICGAQPSLYETEQPCLDIWFSCFASMWNGKSELGCSSKTEAPRAFHPWADWKIHFDIMLSFLHKLGSSFAQKQWNLFQFLLNP